MKVKLDLSRFLMLIFLMIVSVNLFSINFYVSPKGSDQNSGNLKAPFKSIEKARDAIRMLADSEQEQDIVIFLMGGEYRFTETLVFNVMDGAPEGHSVVYKAYQNEKPVITSARSISGWEPVKDFPEELPASARGNVWVADIPDYGNEPWYFRTMYNGDQLLTRAVSEKFVPTNFIPEPYLKYRYKPELLLFNLENDVGEQHNLAAQHPGIIEKLMEEAEKAYQDLGNYNRVGAGARFFEEGEKWPNLAQWRDHDDP